jgi:hypothetical protein
MANADFHSFGAGLGDFEQTQNAIVFLSATQQTVVLHVKVNTWSETQTYPKNCSTIQWKQ